MNLTRQMQGIADLYSSVKPIEEQTYKPQPSSTQYSSTSDRNAKTLNNMYVEILNKSTGKNTIISESVKEQGPPNPDTEAREQIILNATVNAAENPGPDPDINDLVFKIRDEVKAKTGKAPSPEEDQRIIDGLKKVMNQEDEIDIKKSDLNSDGKLSGYEQARGSAIDRAMGGSGEMPKGEHVAEAKSYSAKQARKGKDIGKPGKQFAKIAKGAAKKYGSKKAGKKVAGAVLAKLRSEKFDFFGTKKNPNLMTSKTYKAPKAKNFKQPVGGKVKFQSLPGATEQPTKTPFIKNSGPQSDGVVVPQKPLEPGGSKENVYNVNKFSDEVKKIDEKNINNDMSKSIFDKLYEDVMADDDAIALGATDAALDSDMGGEGEAEGSDEVTLTLPREVAQHLHSLLAYILGSEAEASDLDEMGEEGDEMGEEDEQYDQNMMGEEIEAEELGHPLVNQKKGDPTPVKGKSNVVDSTVSKLAKTGKGGDGKVTDKVGNDGDEGHPLVNQTKGTELANPKGKANVVKSTTSSKVGDTFFQAN